MRIELLTAVWGGSDLLNVVLLATMSDKLGKETVKDDRLVGLEENFWRSSIGAIVKAPWHTCPVINNICLVARSFNLHTARSHETGVFFQKECEH
ncbi:hypothetical protein FIBSPDRAFT_325261 [Athelia psychrophila]|uniref:Uncharacterized protein n=1 Tax=Athelia psychrophila TaxID=1759441 RepID=A0A167WM18_9AGAM|nr:hypothetical protein FIBSPDRAFT_325261 [Fibularhizoctonia sp. CBS 109695]